jgi:hypothetical protein
MARLEVGHGTYIEAGHTACTHYARMVRKH